MTALGIWINQAQQWACTLFANEPRQFESFEAAHTYLVASGFINSTCSETPMTAYVSELPPFGMCTRCRIVFASSGNLCTHCHSHQTTCQEMPSC